MLLQLFGLFFIIITIYWYLVKPKNLPPGPTGIPLLGYLPWIIYYSKNRMKLLNNLKKYGNIVCIRVGFNYMIILFDMNSIKEAFLIHGDHFSGRGLKLFQREISHSKGILSSEGPYQRENRRFILRTLRNLGFGKMSFEDQIMESIETMFYSIDKHLHDNPNAHFDFRQSLTEAVAENITQIVLGIKFDKSQLLFIINRIEMIQNVPQIFFMANSFDFVNMLSNFKFFKKMLGLETFKEIRIPLQNMIMKYVQNHKKTFNKNNISDLIYNYIEEQYHHQKSVEEAYWWDDEQIMHACTDLIAAGIGTTDATISWFLFLMANDKEWQQLVQEEIDHVIGRDRKPSSKDLSSLPFCEASILETFRWSSLASTGIPHSATEDTNLFGFHIPKDSIILGNLYSVGRDKNVWIDPEHFNPIANFLNSERKEIINRDKFIPFGTGRRSCVGESLARMEIALFFITIFQKYTISLDPKFGMAPLIDGLFRLPGHRKLIFQLRI